MSEIKFANIKWFDVKRGFGYLLTENNNELWFHASDRQVLMLNHQKALVWLNSPTPEPVQGEMVVYEEGSDAQGRRKAAVWGHAYEGLKNLVNRESLAGFPKTPWGQQLYVTRAGTVVYAREGWGKMFEKRVDTVDFEADPEAYEAEVADFRPGGHPKHWEKLESPDTSMVRYEPWDREKIFGYPVGTLYYWLKGAARITNDGDYADNGQQGRVQLQIHERTENGVQLGIEQSYVYFHRDGTVRMDSDAPLATQLVKSVGFEVVTDERPITAKEAIAANFDAFTARNKPTAEREAEILIELRERFGWEIYPPETAPVATLVVPVGRVYSDIAKDGGEKATEENKVALIGVYDVSALSEWQALMKKGVALRLNGSFAWGPGTHASSNDVRVQLPDEYGSFDRIKEGGHMTDHTRWQLLAYAKDEAGLAVFRKRFEALNAISGSGAVIVIGIDGQLGATNVMG